METMHCYTHIIFHRLLHPESNQKVKQPNPIRNPLVIIWKKNLQIKFTKPYLPLFNKTYLFVSNDESNDTSNAQYYYLLHTGLVYSIHTKSDNEYED